MLTNTSKTAILTQRQKWANIYNHSENPAYPDMSEQVDLEFYQAVKKQLQSILSILAEVQRRLYDYQKELAEEIKIYREAYAKDGLAYVLGRSSHFRSGKPLPGEISHQRIHGGVELFISAYEGTLRAHYPDELLSFAQESAALRAHCENLKSAFAVEYFDNPLPVSPIEIFDRSVRKIKSSVSKKIELIDQLLKVQKLQAIERKKVAFIAKGFEEDEEIINNHFEGILDSLRIPYSTGEPYGCGSIPDKIRQRIKASDVLIAIAQKRYIKGDAQRGAAPAWIIREMTYAQNLGRPLIIVAEEVDLAGFAMEKEIIFFEKNQPKSLQRATKKFLEALVVHGLTKQG